MEGCPNDKGTDKSHLDFTLLDFYDTTEEKPNMSLVPPADVVNADGLKM